MTRVTEAEADLVLNDDEDLRAVVAKVPKEHLGILRAGMSVGFSYTMEAIHKASPELGEIVETLLLVKARAK